jgi:hypothetical protein
MTKKSTVVKTSVIADAFDMLANSALAEGSKKPTVLAPIDSSYQLTSTDVSLTRQIVKSLSDAEKAFEDTEIRKKAMVSNLHDLLMQDKVVDEKTGAESVRWGRYKAVRALFVNEWIAVRKCDDKSAEKAFQRYFNDTGLTQPVSDDSNAVRMREKKLAMQKKLESVANIPQAIADAVAVADFDLAKKLKAEEKRRFEQANKDLLATLDPIKSGIIKEIKSCTDKATLLKIADLLAKAI